jgi:hypothetical protein
MDRQLDKTFILFHVSFKCGTACKFFMENNSYDSWVKQGENEKEELKIEVI